MGVVVPGGFGHALDRQRQGRPGERAQLADSCNPLHPARHKARAQSRQVRAFGQRMEGEDPLGVGPHLGSYLQDADRRRVTPDLGIAFIRKDQEIVLLRQRQQIGPIVPAGHGALRVGRRADIGNRGAVQGLGVEAREIGQKAGLGGGVDIDGVSRNRQRRHGIDLIEGVRHQHDRLLASLLLGAQRDGGVEQPFPRAVQRHDPIFGHRDAIAPPDPARDRRQQFRRAVIRRIDAETCQMFGKDRTNKARHRVPRLADGHGNLFTAGRVCIEQLPQTRKRIIRQVREPLRKRHFCLMSGVFAPFIIQNSQCCAPRSSKTGGDARTCGQVVAFSPRIVNAAPVPPQRPDAADAPRPWGPP